MELYVSNEFLSLFLPEQSSFNSEEIREEFKIYIFRLMNITVDSLIQEQINNDYENDQLKKKYKDFFSNRISSVLHTNELYKEIQNKTHVIKSSLEKNISTIEQTQSLFTQENSNKELLAISNNIRINKYILKNTQLIELFSVPSSMIQCFERKEYELYLEYYNYVMGIPNDDNLSIIAQLKNIVVFVDKMLSEFLKNLLSIDYSDINVNPEIIFDILHLKVDKDIFPEGEVDLFKKKITAYLYQIELFNNKKALKKNFNLLNFFESKIILIEKCLTTSENREEAEVICLILRMIFEKYLFSLFKILFEHNDYFKTKEKVCSFLKSIRTFEICPDILIEVDFILKNYFYKNLEEALTENENYIKNYLTMTKDIKKFFTALIPQNPNKTTTNLKYEILFILFNNFAYINNIVVSETFLRHKDKVETISKLNNHCNKLIQIVAKFFNDNYINFKINNEIEKEFNNFKELFVTNLLSKFLIDIYSFFKMAESFDSTILYSEKKLNYSNKLLI